MNYGHTLGHAIERREHYRWRHGEAISVGMIFVAELSRLAGRSIARPPPAPRPSSAQSACRPLRRGAFDELLATMALDKKTRGATLRFVILESLAKARILAGPDQDLLREAYRAIAS